MKNSTSIFIASVFISGLLAGCSEPPVDCSKTTLTAAQRAKSCQDYDHHKQFLDTKNAPVHTQNEGFKFDRPPSKVKKLQSKK